MSSTQEAATARARNLKLAEAAAARATQAAEAAAARATQAQVEEVQRVAASGFGSELIAGGDGISTAVADSQVGPWIWVRSAKGRRAAFMGVSVCLGPLHPDTQLMWRWKSWRSGRRV
jgi:hypothetical protein